MLARRGSWDFTTHYQPQHVQPAAVWRESITMRIAPAKPPDRLNSLIHPPHTILPFVNIKCKFHSAPPPKEKTERSPWAMGSGVWSHRCSAGLSPSAGTCQPSAWGGASHWDLTARPKGKHILLEFQKKLISLFEGYTAMIQNVCLYSIFIIGRGFFKTTCLMVYIMLED